jgi:carboxyl-terminal processing protease
VILGERSFGKGLVQQYRKLTYGTQLKLTISKYYTPSGRCIQELDYSNRDSNGDISKFSDGIVNSFRTKNGRVVYDGGGISPDILVNFPEKTAATLALIRSKAIFNFSTDFYYNNPTISLADDYSFSSADFNFFLNYLQTTDTIFKTTQENLFSKAFNSIKDLNLIDEKNKEIREVLLKEKLSQITNDQAYLSQIIKNEILVKYYYKKGVFQNKLTKDKVILEAVKILKNKNKYAKILKEV